MTDEDDKTSYHLHHGEPRPIGPEDETPKPTYVGPPPVPPYGGTPKPGVPERTREVDTGVQELIRLVALEVAEAVGGKSVEESDKLLTRSLTVAKASAEKEAKFRTRKLGILIGSILAVLSGGAVTWWQTGGPQAATERAEMAAERADTKSLELELAEQEAMRAAQEAREQAERASAMEQAMREQRRQEVDGGLERVNERVGSVEGRAARLEGRAAGMDQKLDALLEHQLGSAAAKQVRGRAQVTASAVEQAALAAGTGGE